MRTSAVAMAIALVLGLVASAPAEAEAPRVWYAERISTGDAPMRVQHYWSKGPRLRSETVVRGRPIVTIVSGERYVMIDRLARRGISIQRSPKAIQEDAGRGRPFGNELDGILAGGGELVGSEQRSGLACDLYRLTDSSARRELCVTQDERRLPLFGRVRFRATGDTTEIHYADWIWDQLEIHDAFFQPEPDVALEHIGYDDYLRRATEEQLFLVPPLHGELLHGS
jgi:hypothetical protein